MSMKRSIERCPTRGGQVFQPNLSPTKHNSLLNIGFVFSRPEGRLFFITSFQKRICGNLACLQIGFVFSKIPFQHVSDFRDNAGQQASGNGNGIVVFNA
jgi:hypothetical protein